MDVERTMLVQNCIIWISGCVHEADILHQSTLIVAICADAASAAYAEIWHKLGIGAGLAHSKEKYGSSKF